jgi:arsenite methyltransferase
VTETKPTTFDAATSARVDRMYQNADIVAQRIFVREHLALSAGEQVMDVGAGPGLLALEMAAEVGPDGKVIALDPSEAMRAIAESRCKDHTWITVADGDAMALPLALSEINRVLKPGGRFVVLDTDWDSAVINTSDRARMTNMLSAWRTHFVHPDLPGRLPRLIRDSGLELTFAGGTAVVNTTLGPGTYAGDIIPSIAKHGERRGDLSPEICASWLKELENLDALGDFFFSLTRYLFVTAKPDL